MVFSLLPTVVLAEGGDSTAPTIITMQYDDYADYGSDVTVAPDDTVLEVVDGKLHAKGIGSATFTAGTACGGAALVPVFVVAGANAGLGLAERAAVFLAGTPIVGGFAVLVHGEPGLADRITCRKCL